MRRVLLLLLAIECGCAIDANPPPRPTDEVLVRHLLAAEVPAGAVELDMLFDDSSDKADAAERTTLTKYALGNGGTLLLAHVATPRPTDRLYLHRGGVFSKVQGELFEAALDATQIVPIGDDAIVLRCARPDGVAAIVRGTTLTPLRDSATWCTNPARLGPSTEPGHFTILTYEGELQVKIGSYRVEGDAIVPVTTPTAIDLEKSWEGPSWFGEVADGVIATAWLAKDKWRYQRSDRAPLTIPSPLPDGVTVRRSGATFDLLGYEGENEVWRSWNVEGDGAVSEGGTVAPHGDGDILRPTGSFGELLRWSSIENDEYPRAPSIPTDFRMRVEEPRALTFRDFPSTPCASRERCRTIGESYPLGVVGGAGARFGVYLFWSWNGPAFLWASPLDGRAAP